MSVKNICKTCSRRDSPPAHRGLLNRPQRHVGHPLGEKWPRSCRRGGLIVRCLGGHREATLPRARGVRVLSHCDSGTDHHSRRCQHLSRSRPLFSWSQPDSATALRALGLARRSIAARAPPVSSPIPDPEQSFVPAGARCSRILPPFPVLSRLKARLPSLLRLNSNLSRHQQACAEPSAES